MNNKNEKEIPIIIYMRPPLPNNEVFIFLVPHFSQAAGVNILASSSSTILPYAQFDERHRKLKMNQ